MKDAAAEAETEKQQRWTHSRKRLNFIEEHGSEEIVSALVDTIAALAAKIRARGTEAEENAELFFIAEVVSLSQKMERRRDANMMLRQLAKMLGKEHAAARAILSAIAARDRDDRLALIEIGQYRAFPWRPA